MSKNFASANKYTVANCLQTSGKSLKYSINNLGHAIPLMSEKNPFNLILCFQKHKKINPVAYSFNRSWCGTLSNAFSKLV